MIFYIIYTIMIKTRVVTDKLPVERTGKGKGKGKGRIVDNNARYRLLYSDMESQLNIRKTQLDQITNEQLFMRIRNGLHPYKNLNQLLVKIYAVEQGTNAWIKMWEIANEFLEGKLPERLTHFDNGALPGAFILAMHHFASNRNIEHVWKASSLYNDVDNTALLDNYNLYRDYPQNWTISETNNGDVTNPDNIIDIAAKIGKVFLYTSDIGIDIRDDFNGQEKLNVLPHFGQMITGLAVLETGGIFIGKHYTLFEPINQYVVEFLYQHFDELHLCKPVTSRAANSETYIIGIGFKGITVPALNLLYERLRSRKMMVTTEITVNESIAQFMRNVIDRQIASLTAIVAVGEQFKNSPFTPETRQRVDEQTKRYFSIHNGMSDKQAITYWIRQYSLEPLPADARLIR